MRARARARSLVIVCRSHPADAALLRALWRAHAVHNAQLRDLSPGARRDGIVRGWRHGARRVLAPAGSLLLWSSRLAHTGWNGGTRLAQCVAMQPRALCAPALRERPEGDASSGALVSEDRRKRARAEVAVEGAPTTSLAKLRLVALGLPRSKSRVSRETKP